MSELTCNAKDNCKRKAFVAIITITNGEEKTFNACLVCWGELAAQGTEIKSIEPITEE